MFNFLKNLLMKAEVKNVVATVDVATFKIIAREGTYAAWCAVNYNSTATAVAVKEVPHFRGTYGKVGFVAVFSDEGKSLCLRYDIKFKSETDAFEEYFSAISLGVTPTHFNSVEELLAVFPTAEVLNVKHSSAGSDPVRCSGGSTFNFSGGLSASGKSGSGQGAASSAQAANTATFYRLKNKGA